jgi:hypothetical protein
MKAAALISTHLNAPVGAVLLESDVLDSLKKGYLCAGSDNAKAVLAGMFVELEPRLIVQCALEANSSAKVANLLYLDTLSHASPRCPQWEAAMEFML